MIVTDITRRLEDARTEYHDRALVTSPLLAPFLCVVCCEPASVILNQRPMCAADFAENFRLLGVKAGTDALVELAETQLEMMG